MGLAPSTVQKIWKAHGLAPHKVKVFKLSNDPAFAEKLENIIGLYVNPPKRAVVFSVDEKSQIQALDRTQPGLPLKKGRGQTMTMDWATRKVLSWRLSNTMQADICVEALRQAIATYGPPEIMNTVTFWSWPLRRRLELPRQKVIDFVDGVIGDTGTHSREQDSSRTEKFHRQRLRLTGNVPFGNFFRVDACYTWFWKPGITDC